MTVLPWLSLLLAVALFALLGAVAFGGPSQPPPMAGINTAYQDLDLSDLPKYETYTARDGTSLAYRRYLPSTVRETGLIVLVHGSAARSDSLHALAAGLASAGYAVFVPDVRGHGESGDRGRIAYVGQLEDDLEDLRRVLPRTERSFLIGFSAGGGFALRFAASPCKKLFTGYVLLAPFLSQTATTYRVNSGGWVSVGLLRIVAIAAWNVAGVRAFNRLPVTRYALHPSVREKLTPWYSYALALNFRPNNDYRADIRQATQPMEVFVGGADDQFHADRFVTEFEEAASPVAVNVLVAIGHAELTLSSAAISAVVQAANRLGVQEA